MCNENPVTVEKVFELNTASTVSQHLKTALPRQLLWVCLSNGMSGKELCHIGLLISLLYSKNKIVWARINVFCRFYFCDFLFACVDGAFPKWDLLKKE